MRSFTQLFWTIAILLGLSALSAAYLTGGATALHWAQSTLEEQPALGDSIARAEQLEVERTFLLGRIEVKRQLAAEVVARRLTLAEAARRFRILHQQATIHLTMPEPVPPNPSEEEEFCREVLGYVEDALTSRPDEADAVRTWLEEELWDHLALQGPRPGDAGGPPDGQQ
jgi:hypothetical protein